MDNEGNPDQFPDTRWSLIRSARVETRGLEDWCRDYWRPVREYLRALGCSLEEAEEITQEFFQRMLQRGPEDILRENLNGAFRAFLKRSVKNFLIDRRRAQGAKRRGGDLAKVDLEVASQFVEDPQVSPESAFDQAWALRVMDLAIRKLRDESLANGRQEFFEVMSPFLDGRETDRAVAIEKLGLNEGSFRAALYRLRKRYRALIEQEVRETVAEQGSFEEEMRHLLGAWS